MREALQKDKHYCGHSFNPIQDGPFRGCSQMGGWGKKAPLTKASCTYPAMINFDTVVPYLKKIQKTY